MPPILGTLRRIALAPSLRAVTFAERRFPGAGSPAAGRLEAIPQSVVCGFEWAVESRTQWDVERRLALVEPELRGFAFEGAAMAYTVRDAMAAGRGTRARGLLSGPGRPHIFLTYIGIGFAMSRLPRPLWKNVMPDLTGTAFYPTMSWFAVDGYGFDLAYFHTGKWVDKQRVPRPYPWDGDKDYFLRAVDQGIGRALWFIHGADPEQAAAAVLRFGRHRRADLWSGVGLAAVFAGGCEPEALRRLLTAAGDDRSHVSLGAVLAAKGRHYSGFVPAHTEDACPALTGMTVDEAVELADRTEVAPDAPGPVPPYELWRQRIRSHFTDPADQPVGRSLRGESQ